MNSGTRASSRTTAEARLPPVAPGSANQFGFVLGMLGWRVARRLVINELQKISCARGLRIVSCRQLGKAVTLGVNETRELFSNRDAKVRLVAWLGNEGAAEVDERLHDGTLPPRMPAGQDLLKRRKNAQHDRVVGACMVVAHGPEEGIAGIDGGLLIVRIAERHEGAFHAA